MSRYTKTCCSCRSRCRMDAWIAARKDFRRSLRPAPQGMKKNAVSRSPQKDRFRGVRIFDISDIKNPKQVAAVQTCRGSHTHTLVLGSERQGQRLYLRVRHIVCAPTGRTGWMLGRKSGQGPEHGAVSHRSDQSSGGGPAGRENRFQPSPVYRSANRRAERPEQRRQPRQG